MKTRKIEFKWAFIHAAMFLLWMTMEKLAGLHDKHLEQQQAVTMLILIPSIIIYVLTLLDKKKHYHPEGMSYKQRFVTGLVLTLFIVALSPVNQLITSYIITPDYFTNAIEHTVKAGIFTQEQAEQQFCIKNYLVTGAAGGLITGVIFSVVIALFTKSRSK